MLPIHEKYPIALETHLWKNLEFILSQNHSMSICQLLRQLIPPVRLFDTSNSEFIRNVKDKVENILAENTANYKLVVSPTLPKHFLKDHKIIVLNKKTNQNEVWIQNEDGKIQFGAFRYSFVKIVVEEVKN